MRRVRRLAALAIVLGTFPTTRAFADLSFATPTSTVTVDFTGFTGAGFAPAPAAGQLDSSDWAVTGFSDGDLAFEGTRTTSGQDYTRGTVSAAVVTGGIFSFDSGGADRRLMIQPIGADFTPGTFTLRIQNLSGQTLSSFGVEYDLFVRNDETRANSFNFSYSNDDATYTPVAGLNYTSPEAITAGGPVEFVGTRSTTIFGLNVLQNDYLYLRWTGDDVSGANNRDEFFLDNIDVSAIPEPASVSLAGIAILGAAAGQWVRRRARMPKRTP